VGLPTLCAVRDHLDDEGMTPKVADVTFRRRWIVTVSIAEALGFAVASSVALTAVVGGLDGVAGFALPIAGGAVEGALLGAGQWLAMGQRRPHAAAWIGATAAGATIAWTLGMLPSTLGLDFASPLTFAAVGVGALVLLASIPVAQWSTLGARVGGRRSALRWIPVNMAAWGAAVLWTIAPSPFVDEHSPVALIAALYVVAGILMALTIATLTSRTARTLFA
jgi:hypothetical protein